MLTEIENRLSASGIPGLIIDRQSLYQDKSGITEPVPQALLALGKHEYSPSKLTGRVQQRVKTFLIYLIASSDEIDSLEDEIVASLIQWQMTPDTLPVEMKESETRDIQGDIYERVLTFNVESLIKPRP